MLTGNSEYKSGGVSFTTGATSLEVNTGTGGGIAIKASGSVAPLSTPDISVLGESVVVSSGFSNLGTSGSIVAKSQNGDETSGSIEIQTDSAEIASGNIDVKTGRSLGGHVCQECPGIGGFVVVVAFIVYVVA